MAVANPLAGPSALRDVIYPQFHQNNFPAESYIKTELGVKLDKGWLRVSGTPNFPTKSLSKMTKYADWP
jgi:hypothetical protein